MKRTLDLTQDEDLAVVVLDLTMEDEPSKKDSKAPAVVEDSSFRKLRNELIVSGNYQSTSDRVENAYFDTIVLLSSINPVPRDSGYWSLPILGLINYLTWRVNCGFTFDAFNPYPGLEGVPGVDMSFGLLPAVQKVYYFFTSDFVRSLPSELQFVLAQYYPEEDVAKMFIPFLTYSMTHPLVEWLSINFGAEERDLTATWADDGWDNIPDWREDVDIVDDQ